MVRSHLDWTCWVQNITLVELQKLKIFPPKQLETPDDVFALKTTKQLFLHLEFGIPLFGIRNSSFFLHGILSKQNYTNKILQSFQTSTLSAFFVDPRSGRTGPIPPEPTLEGISWRKKKRRCTLGVASVKSRAPFGGFPNDTQWWGQKRWVWVPSTATTGARFLVLSWFFKNIESCSSLCNICNWSCLSFLQSFFRIYVDWKLYPATYHLVRNRWCRVWNIEPKTRIQTNCSSKIWWTSFIPLSILVWRSAGATQSRHVCIFRNRLTVRSSTQELKLRQDRQINLNNA